MKKTVKSLIIASSVAAIAGIGAVSFAKWADVTNRAVTANGNELGVVAVGASFTADLATGTKFQNLVPIDEEGTGLTKFVKIDLPKIKATKSFKITVTMGSVTLNDDYKGSDSAYTFSGKIYAVNEDKSSATDNKTALTAAGSKWVEVVSGGAVFTYTVSDSKVHEYEVDISFALVSDDCRDMGAKFPVTFTIADVT